MDIWITVKIAIKALISNKMRAFLTMLGIIIGVGSVISMIAIANGAKESLNANIQANGTNVLMIFASSSQKRGGVHMGRSESIQTLTPDDAEAIVENCKSVRYASPQIRQVARTIYKTQNWSTAILGGNEDYFDIRSWKTVSGRTFTKNEVTSAAKVCVIGSVVVENLFGNANPIGETIRVNKIPFKVIGVLETKGQSGFGGNMDDIVVIPYTTVMQRFYKKSYIRMMMCSATDKETVNSAKDEISNLLRQRHRIPKGGEDDFDIRTQEDMLKMAEETSKFLSLLLGSIASVSLLVGGIGIMNIMLVSVTERIREIGIRMAVGAKRKDILLQFITEAVVLSIIGGLMGVGLGYLIAWFISALAKWKTLVSMNSIILSISFSFAIGLFFGLYPAWRASKLDPIEALRQE
ncbi:MAG: ABC transporter permease [Firmicutes bacterium]|nr:ABC transporter permease [Bacillota bacterium]